MKRERENSESGGVARFLLIAVGGFSLVFALFWFMFRDDERFAVVLNFFERGNPEVAPGAVPPGVGAVPARFEFVARDDGTGLDEVIVRTDQEGDVREVLRKRYPSSKLVDRVEVSLNGKELGLSEGDFALNIRVFDRSFWSNGREATFDFKVDYGRPRMEVLSAQHNAVVGGSELLFYRLLDRDIAESGAVSGSREFRGYPAKALDSEFETATDLYISFFAIPLTFDDTKDTVTAFARDEVQNLTTMPFYYKAAKLRRINRTREISRAFLTEKLEAMLGRYSTELKREVTRRATGIQEDFRLVNEDYAAHTNRRIAKLLRPDSAAEPKRLWSGPFLRPVGAALRADYSEGRTYIVDGEEVGTALQYGVSFAAPLGTSVVAAGKGVVAFAGDLGPYGIAVLLDHGLGLSSLYGHLSQTSVKKGDTVDQGQLIAQSGESGFVDGPDLHFEIRVDGYPVRPIEWWDRHWVRDHVEQKIADMKKMLGIGAGAGE